MFKLSAITFLVFSFPLWAQVNKNGDFQFWDFVIYDQKIQKDVGFRLTGEVRWGDDLSKLYFYYGQAQGVYSKKWIEIAPGFREQRTAPTGVWVTSHMPMVDITLFFLPRNRKSFFKKWELDDRSRIFYVIIHDMPSNWIYRNRLQITSPQLFSHYPLRFFLSEEAFLHQRNRFYENRVSAGLIATLASCLKARLFYMYRNVKQSEVWTYQNVISFQLFFNFPVTTKKFRATLT
jgi:hypothetical protein